jgi:hypothetical protein
MISLWNRDCWIYLFHARNIVGYQFVKSGLVSIFNVTLLGVTFFWSNT